MQTNETIKILEVYKQLGTVQKTARAFKKAERTVRNILIHNGIQPPARGQYSIDRGCNIEMHKELVVDLYCNQGKQISEISSILKCPKGSVSSFLRKNKIPTHIKRVQDKLKANKEEVIRVYHQYEEMNKTAEVLGCDSDSLRLFFKNEKIPYKNSKPYNTSIPTSDEKDKIRRLVAEDNTMTQIGKELNRSGPQIAKICDSNNIPRPTKEEQSRKNGLLSMDSMFRHKIVTLPSGEQIYKQGYEPQFLDYVFSNHLLAEDEIEYRPKSIKYIDTTLNNKSRHYFPDFYIPKYNLIIEVKSEYILKKQTLLNANLKRQATIDLGFNYILILDNNFNEFKQFISNFNK